MRTQERLTEAYAGARVESLDPGCRYVIVSDCHRGDGSHSDDFNRNENAFLCALSYYHENGFVYVEAGDGDELWEQPKFKYMQDAHHDVFQLIKRFHDEERLIILWGNHNIYLSRPEYVSAHYDTYYDHHTQVTHDFLPGLAPSEALVLRHSTTGQEILVLHGHQGDFSNDQFWFPTMLSVRYFWRFMRAFGFRNPASPVKNAQKRHKIEKNYTKWIEKHRMMLICGHTHRYKYPRQAELPYFNTGSCIYPAGMTAIEIIDCEVRLVQWNVTVDGDATLRVMRRVLRGPDPLTVFDIRKG